MRHQGNRRWQGGHSGAGPVVSGVSHPIQRGGAKASNRIEIGFIE